MALEEIELSGHETLPPSPDILDALEQDYPLEASIADLVDNSIDARARNVLIRFMRKEGRLVSLCVADDGCGISKKEVRRAMGFATRRDYAKNDLGMFGVGLKTASLSQAESVIVVSRSAKDEPIGRRWTKSGIKKHDWRLDVLTPKSARSILNHDWRSIRPIVRGTVIRWDGVYDFDRLHAGVHEYLELVIRRIKHHLGLKLHRFLKRGVIRIQIDVEDVDTGEAGSASTVSPLDPFPQKGAGGASGYPKDFVAVLPGAGRLTMRAHIWKKKSRDEGYKLGRGKVAEHQGLYFFRHDRLIQDGGWNGIIGTNEPHMSLARVEVDIPDSLGSYLRVRSNKAGVDVPASFAQLVIAAKSRDGTTFEEFLSKADEVYRRRGELKARPMVAPGAGLPAQVKNALERKGVRFVRGAKCSIAWDKSNSQGLIQVLQEQRKIVLNNRYRRCLLRGAHGGATDLPLLRTLLYFVFENLLSGDRIGPVERQRLEAIQAAMNAALKLEIEWVET